MEAGNAIVAFGFDATGSRPVGYTQARSMTHSDILSFLSSAADLIRDSFKRGESEDVIPALTMVRGLDCVPAPTKEHARRGQSRRSKPASVRLSGHPPHAARHRRLVPEH